MTIEQVDRDDICTLILARPDRLNALTPAMADDLRQRLQQAQHHSRVIVLKGAGRGFCAGADLSDDAASAGPDVDGGAVLADHYNPLILAIRALRVPIIAEVHGAAAGMGAALALNCDLVLAAADAYFLAPFVRIGLAPDGGVAHLLAVAAGKARAMRLLLLAERLPAAEALALGLVSHVVDGAALADEVKRVAARLAHGPTLSYVAARRLVLDADARPLTASLAAERELQRDVAKSRDCQEGIRAFREARNASFEGR